ncbi:translation initiation factor eIF2B catalytic subunit epsilon [Saccharomycopsis crataegensis]|uniref:Translation initiation factor eIF2B subunit epsilon n=1 Tax=Saccharomycopsis crataegensis TaxID=43959 RepID=A0AAV5QQE3_9ASCO|nr:translation initiation factor eIF2B catalytic subunit epsilon [Saccharomycopsis crataegensis]
MAPKSSSKKQKEVIKKEKLQAVVLTDDFETKFMPLTATTPRCLIHLGNVPLIEYTLEFLANAGANEVYLMCSGNHVEPIQQYIDKSKWSLPWSPFKVQCIISLEARSIGDVMRDLDNRSIITDDFLLISGDVITNINFDDALKYHRKIKESDRDHIVTMITTEATSNHRSRPFDDDPSVFVLNESNNKCLYYDAIPPINGEKSQVSIDPELLENIDDFVIRNDLIDCHIDICTPIVPAIYSENFDFQHMRKDFLKGILTFDLLKRSFYVYIAQQEYGARVSSYSTFKSITKDLIQRFIYPIVPELNFYNNNNLKYESNHIYKDKKVVLAQSCKIGYNTVLGADSFIDENTEIQRSVIGNNVKIGKNCSVVNSIIFDDVQIQDGVTIVDSCIGGDVVIRNNVSILHESVIGANCVIDNDMVIEHGTKIIAKKPEEVDDGFFSENDEDEESTDDNKPIIKVEKFEEIGDVLVVGPNGVGFRYEEYESDVEDSSDADSVHSRTETGDIHALYKLSTLALSDESIASVGSSVGKNKKKHGHKHHDSISGLSNKKSGRSYSTASQISNADGSNLNPEKQRLKEIEEFYVEATATIERAIDNNHDIDTAVLELNTLRMSMNVTYSMVRRSTLNTLISKITNYVETNTLKVNEATNKLFGQWGILFKRQVFDKDDELDLLDLLNEICKKIDAKEGDNHQQLNAKQLQFFIMRQFYDLEICDEENIIEWYNGSQKSEDASKKIDNKYVEQLIDWLQSAEEESSEEEESDDEEEESDDEE